MNSSHKLFFLLALNFLFTLSAAAQHRAYFFFDDKWRPATQESHAYYRMREIDTAQFTFGARVKDFYKDGTLLMNGLITSGIKQDTFYFFHPNGKLQMKGAYKDDKRTGLWTTYYESGRVKEKVIFDDSFVTIDAYYDESGVQRVLDGTGRWSTAYFTAAGLFSIDAEFSNQRRHGTWNYYLTTWKDDQPTKRHTGMEQYDHGTYLSGRAFPERGPSKKLHQPYSNIFPELTRLIEFNQWARNPPGAVFEYMSKAPIVGGDTTTYRIVEEAAMFPGGIQAMTRFIGMKLRYPKDAREKGVEGSVFVSFVIEKNGTINLESVHAVAPVFPSLDSEAIQLIKSMPPWTPAKQNGKAVRSRFVLPIRFKSDDNSGYLPLYRQH